MSEGPDLTPEGIAKRKAEQDAKRQGASQALTSFGCMLLMIPVALVLLFMLVTVVGAALGLG